MARESKLQKLTRIGRALRAQQHETIVIQGKMPHIRMKANWSEQVIVPLTTAIDNIELLITKAKKLKREQGFLASGTPDRKDDTFGGLL